MHSTSSVYLFKCNMHVKYGLHMGYIKAELNKFLPRESWYKFYENWNDCKPNLSI
jgi:hypothetical protein